jgi:hypothetical protein
MLTPRLVSSGAIVIFEVDEGSPKKKSLGYSIAILE